MGGATSHQRVAAWDCAASPGVQRVTFVAVAPVSLANRAGWVDEKNQQNVSRAIPREAVTR